MKYRVVITPAAEADLRAAHRFIRRDSPSAAKEWTRGIRKKIRSLANRPLRAPLAPEAAYFDEPIHELFYGSGNRGTYRILFTIIRDTVFVVHVRHGSRGPLTTEL